MWYWWAIAILCILIPYQMKESLKNNPEHPFQNFIGGMIGNALLIVPIVWIVAQVINAAAR